MSSGQEILWVVALAAFAASACGDDTSPAGTSSGGAGGAGGTGGTGGQGGQGTSSSTGTGGAPMAPQPAMVRVAHLAPDAPPVDLCLSLGNGTFIGPVLKSAGLALDLDYTEVLAPVNLPAGPLVYRFVAADAEGCGTALDGAVDSTLTTADNMPFTIVVSEQVDEGSGAVTLDGKIFPEEAPPATDKVRLRFVHLSPDTGSVDFGMGAAGAFTETFADVAFGSAGAAGASAYVEFAPLDGATLSVRLHGSDVDEVVAPQVTLPGGTLATAFLIGRRSGDPKPLQFLLCGDNGPKINYTYTPCAVLP